MGNFAENLNLCKNVPPSAPHPNAFPPSVPPPHIFFFFSGDATVQNPEELRSLKSNSLNHSFAIININLEKNAYSFYLR